MRATCAYCGTEIRLTDDGVWVDSTDGDCCWGDDETTNEGLSHTTERVEVTP